VLKEHTGSVSCLQALPDGTIVSGSYDTIRIWRKGADDTWTSTELEGHTNEVSCLQALPDGTIVSGSWDATIRIWDGSTPGEGFLAKLKNLFRRKQ
jgi:phospholipase A-2-activating protein